MFISKREAWPMGLIAIGVALAMALSLSLAVPKAGAVTIEDYIIWFLPMQQYFSVVPRFYNSANFFLRQ